MKGDKVVEFREILTNFPLFLYFCWYHKLSI